MFDHHNGKVAVKKLASIITTSIRPFVTTLMLFVHRELCGINRSYIQVKKNSQEIGELRCIAATRIMDWFALRTKWLVGYVRIFFPIKSKPNTYVKININRGKN